MPLFDKCGGYRKLDSFTLATVIQLGTIRFCERFLDRRNDPCGRTYDQMTQAARSGRQNIIEGSERASTSKETEMKLTDVARASLAELRGDYEIWVLKHGQPPWDSRSTEAQAVFGVRLDPVGDSATDAHQSGNYLLVQQKKFAAWVDSSDNLVAANALLILLHRTIHILNRQLEAQGKMFQERGGFRERLTTARLEARDPRQDEAPLCPDCGKPMRKRKARSGKNAGHDFWGCTGYPECRGVREVEAPPLDAPHPPSTGAPVNTPRPPSTGVGRG